MFGAILLTNIMLSSVTSKLPSVAHPWPTPGDGARYFSVPDNGTSGVLLLWCLFL